MVLAKSSSKETPGAYLLRYGRGGIIFYVSETVETNNYSFLLILINQTWSPVSEKALHAMASFLC